MKVWKRAPHTIRCGAEPHCSVLAGEPYAILSGANWKKIRCARHAGSAVPAHIEDEPERLSLPKPVAFTALQDLTTQFDARKAQAGKDD